MTEPKSTSMHSEDDEFYLLHAKLVVFAPIKLDDNDAEKLSVALEAELELGLEAIRTSLHEKFPNVRIAFEV